MKNLFLLMLLGSTLILSSCAKNLLTNSNKDRTMSYEVDGELITFDAKDIYFTSVFGITTAGATDGNDTNSATHSLDITFNETPEVKMYSDTSGISVSIVYDSEVNIDAPKNLQVNVTENSDEYFRATFSWDEIIGISTRWEIRNGTIDIEK